MDIKEAIKEYQCPGCVCGCDLTCGSYNEDNIGSGCIGHVVGTICSNNIGHIFLGLFRGFNRVGMIKKMPLTIFKSQDQQEKIFNYDIFNIPVWKNQNEAGRIFIRGLSPRINMPFLHIILEGNFEKIDCIEITKEQLDKMD